MSDDLKEQLSNKDNDSSQAVPIPTSASSGTPIPTIRIPPEIAMQGVAASPPQFVTMNEIISAVNELEYRQLIHNIAVDKDFKLTPFEPPQSSIAKVVKETIHQVFWDLLAEELHSEPPIYTHAMRLLQEVKTMLLDVLPPYPQHEKLRQEINEIIDIPFIEQQAKNEALDFLGYAHFIINIMGRICAPVRDEKINEIKQISDPVLIYKGVLETLSLMNLDLANFGIEMVRSNVTNHILEYEKTKFAEVLAAQGGLESLVHTKTWLVRHIQESPNRSNGDIVLSAFLELFEWSSSEEFPETFLFDVKRITDLGHRLQQLIISGTVLLVTLSRAFWPPLQQNGAFKEKLLHDVCVLLQDVNNEESLKGVLPNVAVQVINMIKGEVDLAASSSQGLPVIEVNDTFEQSITELIQDIHRSDHSVRTVVKQRTNEFLRVALSSAPDIPKQLPPGLTSLRCELLSVACSLIRLYKSNVAVYGDYYSQIIVKFKQEIASAS